VNIEAALSYAEYQRSIRPDGADAGGRWGWRTPRSTALLMLLAERHGAVGWLRLRVRRSRERWLEADGYLANTLLPAMRDWFYADRTVMRRCQAVRAVARGGSRAVEQLGARLGGGRRYLVGEGLVRWT